MNLKPPTGSNHDVVIVGAGPSGLAAAAELARHGVRSVLIEPRNTVSHDRPRAKTTSIRTMEHFRRWGIADAVRAHAALAPSWSQRVIFCDNLGGSVITEFDGAFGLSAGPLPYAAESGQQVPQPIVEEVLREHLYASGMVEFRFGERVTRIVEHDDSVVLAVTDSDGVTGDITARYVLGCDGGASPTRMAINAELQGTSAPHANLNVVFSEPNLAPAMGDAVQYWAIGPATPGALGRLDLDGRWWASLAASGDVTDSGRAIQLLSDLVGEQPAGFHPEIHSMDPWTPRMLLADRFASRRIFLVGESAHLNPPFGGHGFNTCVGDAVNIGWKLAAVLQGWGGPGLLDSYESERRAVAEQTIASAETNLRASGTQIARTSDALQQSKAEEFYSLGLVLGYSYADSPAVCGSVGPEPIDVINYRPSFGAGARLPHQWLAPGKSLYDVLGRGFSLLIPSSAQPSGVARFSLECQSRSIPLGVFAVPADVTGSVDRLLLVRPDQHIAWSGADITEADLDIVTGNIDELTNLATIR